MKFSFPVPILGYDLKSFLTENILCIFLAGQGRETEAERERRVPPLPRELAADLGCDPGGLPPLALLRDTR